MPEREPLRLRGYQGAASVHTDGLSALAEGIEAALPGRFALDLVPDATASGATATAMFASLEDGGAEIGYIATGYLSARVAELRLLDLPFLFDGPAGAFRLLDGPGGAIVRDALRRETGLVALGFWDNGLRHITSRVGPILQPGDGAGQSIRMLDTPIYRATVEALGFVPKPFDVRDLSAAVAGGQLDAHENPLTNCHLFGVIPHQPWLSLTGHIQGIVLLVANAAWLGALPEAEQRALAAAADAATQVQRRRASEEDVRLRDVLVAEGARVTEAAMIDRAGMAAACAPFVEATLAALPPGLRACLED